MKHFFSTIAIVLITLISCNTSTVQSGKYEYENNMEWWSNARYGMFIHWGLSSLMGEEISWSRGRYGTEKYDRLRQRFNPKDFDPDTWIDVAEKAGMKYIVLTAKHHDGFCLWDSKANTHNIMNSPYRKDICRMLADACHKRGMRLGWYFSCREWNDSTCSAEGLNGIYVEKMKSELHELLTEYGKIDLLWFDYDGYPCPEQPEKIFTFVRSLQSDIIINNRLYPLTPDESHAHIGPYAMYATPEQFVGGYGTTPWETCTTSSKSRQWAIRFNDMPRPSDDLCWEVFSAAAGNGNILMNVGPDSLGTIPLPYVDTLQKVGDWIAKNGNILYGTTCGPWKPCQQYGATCKGNSVKLVLNKAHDITLPYANWIGIEEASIYGDNIIYDIHNDSVSFQIPQQYQGTRNLVIDLKLKTATNEIPLDPFSTSGSVSYSKKATASSALSFEYMHHPAAAFDDNEKTAWIIGRRDGTIANSFYGHKLHYINAGKERIADVFNTEGILEVDLGTEYTISKFRIKPRGRMMHADLEFSNDHMNWEVSASIENLHDLWYGDIPATTARYWRLKISGGEYYFGIYEMQLFPK